jgi:hypothetical protein
MRALLKCFRPGLAVGLAVLTVAAAGALAAWRSAAKPAMAASASVTVDPAQFDGEAQKAYIVAREHPELLAQLDCYCGCEQHEGHKNLLDCFRTRHGAGCDTCIGEAVTAGKLAEDGMPVEQIREALRDRYAHGG